MKSFVFMLFIFLAGLSFAASSSTASLELKSLPSKKVGQAPYDKVEELKGKVVLMDFWASWCEPCKESLPLYEKLFLKYKDQGLIVITVNLDRNAKERDEFLKEFKINLPIYDDKDRSYAKEFQVEYLPSLFIFDKKLKQVEFYSGFDEKKMPALEKRIQALLKN